MKTRLRWAKLGGGPADFLPAPATLAIPSVPYQLGAGEGAGRERGTGARQRQRRHGKGRGKGGGLGMVLGGSWGVMGCPRMESASATPVPLYDRSRYSRPAAQPKAVDGRRGEKESVHPQGGCGSWAWRRGRGRRAASPAAPPRPRPGTPASRSADRRPTYPTRAFNWGLRRWLGSWSGEERNEGSCKGTFAHAPVAKTTGHAGLGSGGSGRGWVQWRMLMERSFDYAHKRPKVHVCVQD